MRAVSSKKSKGSMAADPKSLAMVVPAQSKAKICTPGLQNLGNTCFFNSVSQVLVETKSLKSILSEDPEALKQFPESLAARTDIGLGPLTSNFKLLLETMWKQQGGTVAPRDLFMQICKKWKVFRGFRQQDAQELMRYLFDGIKQEELDLIKRQTAEANGEHAATSTSSSIVEKGHDTESEKPEGDQNSEPKTAEHSKYVPFIDSCFSGKLVSVIVCDACKKCSYAYEDFFDMSLPVKGPSQLATGLNPKGRLLTGAAPTQSTVPGLEISSTGTDADDNKRPIPDTARPSEAHLVHIRKLLKNVGQSNSEDLSIRRSLNQFTTVDTLEGENKFACENCFKLLGASSDIDKEDKEISSDKLAEAPSLNEGLDSGKEATQEDQTETAETDAKEGPKTKSAEDSGNESINGTHHDSDAESSESEESDGAKEEVDRFGNTVLKKVAQTVLQEQTDNKDKRRAGDKFIFRKAYKRYLVSHLPLTLVLHLKRFEQSGRFGQMHKIEDHVEIPEELDMGPYFIPTEDIEEEEEVKENEQGGNGRGKNDAIISAESAGSKKYRLYGAVVHMGTLGGGHYTNYVLSSKVQAARHQHPEPDAPNKGELSDYNINGTQGNKTTSKTETRQWIACSDTSVRHATLQEVLASRAYLLFYERI
ncbi:Ubiquitin carboxyl-terminal hydrolase 16 [Podila humilis]|nr:Ubiquitin carboxyl-terminal hydrolase 16 [Podila humilis]